MSKLQELIKELCPNGVEFRKLGEVCEIKRGVRVVKNDLINDGKYPVFQNSLIPLGYYDKNNYPANITFVISAGAAGEIGYTEEPIWAADDCLAIISPNNIINKFIYYCLISNKLFFVSKVRRASVPRLSRTVVDNFEIPIPPLEVQNEIVRILDTFTSQIEELQAELQARREQYEYYRNRLLTFAKIGGGKQEVRWMKLGEIGNFVRGNGLQKKDFTETGVGCIHYGQIYTYYGTSTDTTKSFVPYDLAQKLTKVKSGNLVIACTSENIEDVCKAVVWLGEEDIVTGGHACVFAHNEIPKYIAYFFQTEYFFQQKKKYARGAKVIDIKITDLEKISIPVPPLSEQQRIVSILDKFEALVNDLTAGLPAEIAAVQEQYEYYRNKLLTFKRIS